MGRWNSHAYDAKTPTKQRAALRDIRCTACGGWIFKGEPYEYWHGFATFPEHSECCPTDKAERKRRDCREGIDG